MIEFLEVSHWVRKRQGLTTLPHDFTLKKFALDDEEADMDSTGMETTSASAHFQSRSGKKRAEYLERSVCVLVGSAIPNGLAVSWGPGTTKENRQRAGQCFQQFTAQAAVCPLLCDDAEWVDEFCRDTWRVESVTKLAVHRAHGGLNGQYRSQMTEAKL